MKKEHIAVNIGRQFGSGGYLIGEKLSKALNFSFYDKELISIASRQSGLGKEFFEEADEKTNYSIFGSFLGMRSNFIMDYYSTNYLNNETLFRIQSDVIRELADKHSCIFVGRCADYILREKKEILNIFITADLEDRIKRVKERQDIQDQDPEELLKKIDKKRSKYYNYYTNKIWGNAASYHLCINSSLLDIDETVSYIIDLLKKKFPGIRD